MKPRTSQQIAAKLLAGREATDWSQEQLAKKAGTKGGDCAIAHWETGRRQPSLQNLILLCDALELDLYDVLTNRRKKR